MLKGTLVYLVYVYNLLDIFELREKILDDKLWKQDQHSQN